MARATGTAEDTEVIETVKFYFKILLMLLNFIVKIWLYMWLVNLSQSLFPLIEIIN